MQTKPVNTSSTGTDSAQEVNTEEIFNVSRVRKQITEINRKIRRLQRQKRVLLNKLIVKPNDGVDTEYFKAVNLQIYVVKYLQETGETGIALSKRAGVSERTIRKIKSGEDVLVAFKNADKIFSAMNIPLVLNTIPTQPHWAAVITPPPSQYYEE